MLFICTGNSARSQMAEGLARAMGNGRIESYSAGTEPKPINPLAVKAMAEVGIDAMAEVGIDISKHTSKGLAQFLDQDFDCVISVCARAAQTCPAWPQSREQIRWHFDDPAEATGSEEERLRVFRRGRNEIQRRLSLSMLAAKVPVTLLKAGRQ
jgi:arsenate reductase